MNKLCVTFLSLALGVPALAHARDDKTPSLPAADATKAATGASITAAASAKITVSDQDALGDDILSVINLPLAAADAREAGVEETDLKEALDALINALDESLRGPALLVLDDYHFVAGSLEIDSLMQRLVTYLPPDQLDIRPTSVGRGMPNEEVWLVDEAGQRLLGEGVLPELRRAGAIG